MLLFQSFLFITLASQLSYAQYTATYDPNNLPPTTEQGQTGTNQCGTGSNQTSQCQNLYVNSLQDFCLWGPPEPNSVIGAVEEIVVAYCTTPGQGTRLFPAGTILQAHFVETPDYIQITGVGQFTNIGIAAGDQGGELDPHGATGNGNPVGGLVFSNVWTGGSGSGQQIHEWTNYMAVDEFCIRVCKEGPNAPMWCEHIYDTMGCRWVMPGNYDVGFSSCQGDSGTPMGLYPQAGGGTSTFFQGQSATPSGDPAPSTSSCTNFTSAAIFTALPTLVVSSSSVPITESVITYPTPTPTPTPSQATTLPTTPPTTPPTTGSGTSIRRSLGWNALFASQVVFVLSLSMVA